MAKQRVSMAKTVVSPKKRVISARNKGVHAVRKPTASPHVLSKPKLELGFARTESGRLYAPIARTSSVVAPSKIKAGIRTARRQIEESLEEVLEIFTGPYRISQIELEISFNADGKFLGFGVGGATSMKVVVAPEK